MSSDFDWLLVRLELAALMVSDDPPHLRLLRRWREAKTDGDRAEVLIDAQRKLDAYKEVVR